MPPVLTFVARVRDGLPLVSHQSQSHNNNFHDFQAMAKRILGGMGSASSVTSTVAKMSIDADDNNNMTFHYSVKDGICYLTLTESSYPKRLAFLYLEEISEGFVRELVQEYGNDHNNRDHHGIVATAARPYEFIKLDGFLRRMQRDFVDPTTSQNAGRLNDDLQDIHSIMKKNIQEVLNRGEKLDKIKTDSQKMLDRSKQYHWGAKELKYQAMLNQYGPMVAMAVFVIFVLYLKFFW